MNIELILIILLGIFVIILIGVALNMAKTIEQMHQYIGELERDKRIAKRQTDGI